MERGLMTRATATISSKVTLPLCLTGKLKIEMQSTCHPNSSLLIKWSIPHNTYCSWPSSCHEEAPSEPWWSEQTQRERPRSKKKKKKKEAKSSSCVHQAECLYSQLAGSKGTVHPKMRIQSLRPFTSDVCMETVYFYSLKQVCSYFSLMNAATLFCRF